MVIHRDDHTYADGEMECEVDKDGELIEPFIYKEDGVTVECYVSKNIYIEKVKNVITKVVHTGTTWGDDYDKYYIVNREVVYLETMKHGINRVYITYGDGVISEIKYSRREFGCYALGDKAPMLEELI
jgi:hypothetical protein